MQLLNKILFAGYNENLPNYLKRKVYPTNLISLLIFFIITIPASIVSQLFFPEVTIYPLIGAFTCVLVIILNYKGYIYHTRFIISLIPITIAAIYNAYLCKAGSMPKTDIYLIELSLILIPFVVYDLNEKLVLGILVFISSVIILTFPVTNSWFESNIDTSETDDNVWLSAFSNGIAILSTLGSVYGLALLNKNAETESNTLIEQMNLNNDKLKLSEIKLTENIKKIEASQIEEQNRNWAAEGLAKATIIMRNANDNLSAMSDAILVHFIKYLDANQGGLFIVNDSNPNYLHLELKATYAYDRKKFINQKVGIGEGLVGQCFLEKDIIYLTKVPENYITITSGLGFATPTCVLICPLMINENVHGVIEMAFFKELEPHKIEFVKKLAENIAATVSVVKTNEKTKMLLAQSQQQSEEMRAQEEEMRQNMEEMSATQEEMQRKESELTKLLSEANDFRTQMAMQEELLIANMNEMQNSEKEMQQKNKETEALSAKLLEEKEEADAKIELLTLKIKNKDKEIANLKQNTELNSYQINKN